MQKICKNCKDIFYSNNPQQVFCKVKCQLDKYKETSGRISKKLTLPPSTIGEISELLVSSDLLKKGFDVFKALSSSCYCDLIATKKDLILRVEVKTCYKDKNNSKLYFNKSKNNFDIYAVCNRNTYKITYLDKNGKRYSLKDSK